MTDVDYAQLQKSDFSLRDIGDFQVKIVVGSEVIAQLAGQQLSFTPSKIGNDSYGLEAKFEKYPNLASPTPPVHDTRIVAAELLAIAEIQNRVGNLLNELLLKSKSGIDKLKGPNFKFDRSDGKLIIEKEYIKKLFDLSKSRPVQHPFFFETDEISLDSPTSWVGRIKSYAAGVALGILVMTGQPDKPADPKELTQVTTSQQLSMDEAIKITNKALDDAKIPIKIFTFVGGILWDERKRRLAEEEKRKQKEEADRQRREDDIFNDLLRVLRNDRNDVRMLQQYLKQVDAYHGVPHGDMDDNTKKAIAYFCDVCGLPDATDYDSVFFVRELSKRVSIEAMKRPK